MKTTNAGATPPDPVSPPLLNRTITHHPVPPTEADRRSGLDQHATIPPTAAETDITPGDHWLILIGHLTSGVIITLAASLCRVFEDGSAPTALHSVLISSGVGLPIWLNTHPTSHADLTPLPAGLPPATGITYPAIDTARL